MEYRKGYVKALIDILNLLEKQEVTLKANKINNTTMVRKMIKFCLENADEFMSYGDMIEIYYYIKKSGKGKTITERTELLMPSEAKLRKQKGKNS